MYRFRRPKKRQTDGPPPSNSSLHQQQPPQLTLLPDETNFRTSLILPHLTKRFTLLRAEDGSLVSLDTMQAHLRAKRETGQLSAFEENLVLAQYRLQREQEEQELEILQSRGQLRSGPNRGGMGSSHHLLSPPASAPAPASSFGGGAGLRHFHRPGAPSQLQLQDLEEQDGGRAAAANALGGGPRPKRAGGYGLAPGLGAPELGAGRSASAGDYRPELKNFPSNSSLGAASATNSTTGVTPTSAQTMFNFPISSADASIYGFGATMPLSARPHIPSSASSSSVTGGGGTRSEGASPALFGGGNRLREREYVRRTKKSFKEGSDRERTMSSSTSRSRRKSITSPTSPHSTTGRSDDGNFAEDDVEMKIDGEEHKEGEDEKTISIVGVATSPEPLSSEFGSERMAGNRHGRNESKATTRTTATDRDRLSAFDSTSHQGVEDGGEDGASPNSFSFARAMLRPESGGEQIESNEERDQHHSASQFADSPQIQYDLTEQDESDDGGEDMEREDHSTSHSSEKAEVLDNASLTMAQTRSPRRGHHQQSSSEFTLPDLHFQRISRVLDDIEVDLSKTHKRVERDFETGVYKPRPSSKASDQPPREAEAELEVENDNSSLLSAAGLMPGSPPPDSLSRDVSPLALRKKTSTSSFGSTGSNRHPADGFYTPSQTANLSSLSSSNTVSPTMNGSSTGTFSITSGATPKRMPIAGKTSADPDTDLIDPFIHLLSTPRSPPSRSGRLSHISEASERPDSFEAAPPMPKLSPDVPDRDSVMTQKDKLSIRDHKHPSSPSSESFPSFSPTSHSTDAPGKLLLNRSHLPTSFLSADGLRLSTSSSRLTGESGTDGSSSQISPNQLGAFPNVPLRAHKSLDDTGSSDQRSIGSFRKQHDEDLPPVSEEGDAASFTGSNGAHSIGPKRKPTLQARAGRPTRGNSVASSAASSGPRSPVDPAMNELPHAGAPALKKVQSQDLPRKRSEESNSRFKTRAGSVSSRNAPPWSPGSVPLTQILSSPGHNQSSGSLASGGSSFHGGGTPEGSVHGDDTRSARFGSAFDLEDARVLAENQEPLAFSDEEEGAFVDEDETQQPQRHQRLASPSAQPSQHEHDDSLAGLGLDDLAYIQAKLVRSASMREAAKRKKEPSRVTSEEPQPEANANVIASPRSPRSPASTTFESNHRSKPSSEGGEGRRKSARSTHSSMARSDRPRGKSLELFKELGLGDADGIEEDRDEREAPAAVHSPVTSQGDASGPSGSLRASSSTTGASHSWAHSSLKSGPRLSDPSGPQGSPDYPLTPPSDHQSWGKKSIHTASNSQSSGKPTSHRREQSQASQGSSRSLEDQRSALKPKKPVITTHSSAEFLSSVTGAESDREQQSRSLPQTPAPVSHLRPHPIQRPGVPSMLVRDVEAQARLATQTLKGRPVSPESGYPATPSTPGTPFSATIPSTGGSWSRRPSMSRRKSQKLKAAISNPVLVAGGNTGKEGKHLAIPVTPQMPAEFRNEASDSPKTPVTPLSKSSPFGMRFKGALKSKASSDRLAVNNDITPFPVSPSISRSTAPTPPLPTAIDTTSSTPGASFDMSPVTAEPHEEQSASSGKGLFSRLRRRKTSASAHSAAAEDIRREYRNEPPKHPLPVPSGSALAPSPQISDRAHSEYRPNQYYARRGDSPALSSDAPPVPKLKAASSVPSLTVEAPDNRSSVRSDSSRRTGDSMRQFLEAASDLGIPEDKVQALVDTSFEEGMGQLAAFELGNKVSLSQDEEQPQSAVSDSFPITTTTPPRRRKSQTPSESRHSHHASKPASTSSRTHARSTSDSSAVFVRGDSTTALSDKRDSVAASFSPRRDSTAALSKRDSAGVRSSKRDSSAATSKRASTTSSRRKSVQDRPPTPPPDHVHKRKISESVLHDSSVPVPPVPAALSLKTSLSPHSSPATDHGKLPALSPTGTVSSGLRPPPSPSSHSIRSERSSGYGASLYDMYADDPDGDVIFARGEDLTGSGMPPGSPAAPWDRRSQYQFGRARSDSEAQVGSDGGHEPDDVLDFARALRRGANTYSTMMSIHSRQSSTDSTYARQRGSVDSLNIRPQRNSSLRKNGAGFGPSSIQPAIAEDPS